MNTIYVIQIFSDEEGWCNVIGYETYMLAIEDLERGGYSDIDDAHKRIDSLDLVPAI